MHYEKGEPSNLFKTRTAKAIPSSNIKDRSYCETKSDAIHSSFKYTPEIPGYSSQKQHLADSGQDVKLKRVKIDTAKADAYLQKLRSRKPEDPEFSARTYSSEHRHGRARQDSQRGDNVDRGFSQDSLSGDCESIGAQLREIRGQLTKYGSYQSLRMEEPFTVTSCKTDCARESYADSSERQRNSFHPAAPSWPGGSESKRVRREALSEKVENTFSAGNYGSSKYPENPGRLDNQSNCLKETATCDRSQNSARAENVSHGSRISNSSRVHIETSQNDFTRSPKRGHKSNVSGDDHGQFARNSNNKYSDAHIHSRLHVDRSRKFLASTANLSSRETSDNMNEDPNVSTRGYTCMRANQDKGSSSNQNPSLSGIMSLTQCRAADTAVSIDKIESQDKHPWKQAITEKGIGWREPASLRQNYLQHDERSWQDSRSSQLSEVNTTWNKHDFTDKTFSQSGSKVCQERQEADAVKWKASFIHGSESCKEKEYAVNGSQNWAERGEGRTSLYPNTHEFPDRTESFSMNSDMDTVFEVLRPGASRGNESLKDKSHKPPDSKSQWAYEVYSSTSQKEEVLADNSRHQRKHNLDFAQKSENVCSEVKFDHEKPNKDWYQNDKYFCDYSTKVEADLKYKFNHERHYQEVEKRQAFNSEIPKSTHALKESGSNGKEASAVGDGQQTRMNISLHQEQDINGIKDRADDSSIREDRVITPLKPRPIMTLQAAPTDHALLQTCSHENTKPFHDRIFVDPELAVQLSSDNLLISSRDLETRYKTRESEVSSKLFSKAEINQPTTIKGEKFHHGEECKNLDSLNRFISPGANSTYFKLENPSPRQTTNSVDETLIKTVHSIKEDIESVLFMLNTIEEKDTRSAFPCQGSSPPVEPLNSSKDPVANMTCAAADIVKRAFTKLVSFKSTLSADDTDEELNSLSYGEYKKGKEAYVASVLAEEDDYDIETIFSYRDVKNGSSSKLKALNQQQFERRNGEGIEQNFGAQCFKIDAERCTGRKQSLGETSDRVTSRWPPKSVPVSNLLNPNLAEEFSYYMSKQTAEGVVLPSDNYVKGRNKTRVYSSTGTAKDRSKKSYIDRSTRNSLLESVSGYLQHGQRDHQGENKPRKRMEAARRKKKRSASNLRHKLGLLESGSGTAERYPIPTLLDDEGTLIKQVFGDDELDQSDQEIESHTRTGSISSPESSPRMSGLRRKSIHAKEVIINVSETTVHRRVSRSTDSGSDNNVMISRMSRRSSPNKTDSRNSRNKNKSDSKKKDDSNKKGDSKNKGDRNSKSDSKNKGDSKKIDVKKGADSTQRKPGQRGGSNHSLKDSVKAIPKKPSRPSIVKKIYIHTPTPTFLRPSQALKSVSRYSSESDDNLAKSATSSEDLVVKTQVDSRSTQTPTRAGADVVAKSQTPRPVLSSIGVDTHRSSLGTRRAPDRKRRSSRTQARSKDATHIQLADHYKMSSSDTSLFKKSRRSSRSQAKKVKNHQLQKEPVSHYEHTMEEMIIGSGLQRPPRSYASRSHPEVVTTEKYDRHVPSVEKAKYGGNEEAGLSENTDISDISEHTSPLEDHKKFICATSKEKGRAFTKKQETKYALLSVEDSKILRQPLLEDSHIRRMLIKDDKMPQEGNQNPSPQADISSSELNTSMKKLYEEITKLRLQLETSADEMSARPLPNLSRQEDVYRSVRSYKAVSAPGAGSTAAFPMDSNQFTDVFPNIDGTVREIAFAGSQMKSATIANLYKTIANSQKAVSEVAKGGTSKLFVVPEETGEKRATIVAASHEQHSHQERHDAVNYPQSSRCQHPQAQPCGDYTEFAPGEQNRDSQRKEQTRRARRGRSDRARYWPNDDVNAMATGGLSDTTNTQNDSTDKFETAVSEEDSSTQYFSHDASDSSRPLGPSTPRTNVTPRLKTQELSERNETSSDMKRGERTKAGSGFKNFNASGVKSPLAVYGSKVDPSEQKTVINADQGSINNNMKSSDSDIWPAEQNNAAFRDTATRSQSYLYPKTGEFQIPRSEQIPVNIKNGGQNYCHTRQFLQPEYPGLKNLDRVVQLCSQTWLSQLSCPNYFPAASELNSFGAPLSASAVLDFTDKSRGSPYSKGIQSARSCCPSAPHYQSAETNSPKSDYFESKLDNRQAGDSVYTTRFPFIMKYAQDMFIGSVDAQAKETLSRNPTSYPSPRRGSPKRRANSPHLKRSKTSLGNCSAVEDDSVGGHDRAPHATSSRHRSESSPVIESSPVMANYLSNRGQTSRSGFLSKSFGNGTDYSRQRGSSLVDNEVKYGRGGQDCRNWVCNEAVVSCGMNTKNAVSVAPEMLSSSTRAQHPEQPCLQACAFIEETDKGMNHYSDAISARLRKNLTYHRSSEVAVSRDHYAHPDRSGARLLPSGLSEKTNAEKSKGVYDSPSSSKRNEQPKALQLEPGKNQRITTPKTRLEDPDPNDIIASFENMMQQKRPYYVEHCGSRLKKQDGDVPTRACVDEPNDDLGIIKPKFQMVTVANDNNSSIELKQIAASVHFEDDCSGRQAYLEDDTDETITDTLVSSSRLSEAHPDHWLEDVDHAQKRISKTTSNDDLAKSVDCAHADEDSIADSLYHGPLFRQDSNHKVAYDGDPVSDSEADGGYNVPDGEILEDRLGDDTIEEEDDTQNESVSKSSDGSLDVDAWNKPVGDDESECVYTEKMGENDDDLVSDFDEDCGDEDVNDDDDNDDGSEEDVDEGGAEEYLDQKETESSEFEDQSSSQQAVCLEQI